MFCYSKYITNSVRPLFFVVVVLLFHVVNHFVRQLINGYFLDIITLWTHLKIDVLVASLVPILITPYIFKVVYVLQYLPDSL